MALETLKDTKEIGGFPVIVMDDLRQQYPEKFNESGAMDYKWFEAKIRPFHFIYIRHDVNSISFTIQNGPIKEHGINGCQVDTLIHAAMEILKGLNDQFPCKENEAAIDYLFDAITELENRKKDREQRGVEGTSNA